MNKPSEPKTCPCGASIYDPYFKAWYFKSGDGSRFVIIEFCPTCGAHLLPNGEVVPRGELEAECARLREQSECLQHERDFLLGMVEPTGGACPDGWNEDCDDPNADCRACIAAYLATEPWNTEGSETDE